MFLPQERGSEREAPVFLFTAVSRCPQDAWNTGGTQQILDEPRGPEMAGPLGYRQLLTATLMTETESLQQHEARPVSTRN